LPLLLLITPPPQMGRLRPLKRPAGFQIEEVVEFIEGKLQELDAEKAELAAFQVRGETKLNASPCTNGMSPCLQTVSSLLLLTHPAGRSPSLTGLSLPPYKQALDRQRRSIEYALFDKELAEARTKAAKVRRLR
jgi:hypothetical protein